MLSYLPSALWGARLNDPRRESSTGPKVNSSPNYLDRHYQTVERYQVLMGAANPKELAPGAGSAGPPDLSGVSAPPAAFVDPLPSSGPPPESSARRGGGHSSSSRSRSKPEIGEDSVSQRTSQRDDGTSTRTPTSTTPTADWRGGPPVADHRTDLVLSNTVHKGSHDQSYKDSIPAAAGASPSVLKADLHNTAIVEEKHGVNLVVDRTQSDPYHGGSASGAILLSGEALDAPPLASIKTTVPVVFTWTHGGQNVFLIGSFNNWAEKLPMVRSGMEFHVVVELTKEEHQYRSVVRGFS